MIDVCDSSQVVHWVQYTSEPAFGVCLFTRFTLAPPFAVWTLFIAVKHWH